MGAVGDGKSRWGAIRVAYEGRHHTAGCVIGALIFSFENGAVGFGSPFYFVRGVNRGSICHLTRV